jgi:hypothetical protein
MEAKAFTFACATSILYGEAASLGTAGRVEVECRAGFFPLETGIVPALTGQDQRTEV